jgi:hypothetical protein
MLVAEKLGESRSVDMYKSVPLGFVDRELGWWTTYQTLQFVVMRT